MKTRIPEPVKWTVLIISMILLIIIAVVPLMTVILKAMSDV